MLYHLLMDDRRLEAFLGLIGVNEAVAQAPLVYFEYAHLRDLWAAVGGTIEQRNRRYRDAIISMLGLESNVELPTDVKVFNEFFIGHGSRHASPTSIQMPARWNDSRFQAWVNFGEECHQMGGRHFAKLVCEVKWAFNAKPDLVIHLGGDKAICIETKLESGPGHYRVKGLPGADAQCWGGQLALQQFIFELLGYSVSRFVMISKAPPRNLPEGWQIHPWSDVFNALLAIEPTVGRESHMVREFQKRIISLHE